MKNPGWGLAGIICESSVFLTIVHAAFFGLTLVVAVVLVTKASVVVIVVVSAVLVVAAAVAVAYLAHVADSVGLQLMLLLLMLVWWSSFKPHSSL